MHSLTRISAFSVLSNIGVRSIEFHTIGAEVDTHKHNFAHTMICVDGEVDVWSKAPQATDAQRASLKSGDCFVVAAGEEHGAVSRTEHAKVLCVFAHRTPQGEVVQEHAGYWKAAN